MNRFRSLLQRTKRGLVRFLGLFLLIRLRLRWLLFSAPRILDYPAIWNEMVLRHFGAKVGRKCLLCSPLVIAAAGKDYRNLTIGNGVRFNGSHYFDLAGPIVLEDGVSLGPGVIINTHNRFNFNPYLEKVLAGNCDTRGVTIGRGAGVKAAALITMGVTIGADAVVAGGAVVNRDVPARTFVAGVPAKVKLHLEDLEKEMETDQEGADER